MVNTNDFRRYSYTYDAAYAVDAFNQTRSSAAPDVRRGKKKRRKLTLSPNTKLKSREEVKGRRKTLVFTGSQNLRCNRACRFHAFRCALYLRAEKRTYKKHCKH